MATYTCFTRNWYKYEYKNGKKIIVPDARARKTQLQSFNSEEKARQYCEDWNNTHNPGPLSRKCEYTSDY